MRNGQSNCKDINECAAAKSPCKAGEKCTDKRGSYTCTIEACASENDPCVDIGKVCTVDATGAAVCGSCLANLVPTPDGNSCVDDACKPADPCAPLGKACATGNDGKAACGDCLPGLIATPDRTKCVADACTPTDDPCAELGKTCTTGNDGKATCGSCLHNMVLILDGSKCLADACKPTDPCAPLGKTCATGNDAKAACGACLANLVLAPDGRACVTPNACSPDPCATLNRACALGSDGKADCSACKQGYAPPQTDPGNGKCVDINECEDPSTCSDRSCTNTQGSFNCGACNDGFEEVDGQCGDKDECAPPYNYCKAEHRVCYNFLDGKGAECYGCENGWLETGGVCVEQPRCKPGYMVDALQCVNIDECVAGTHECGPDAYCVDNDGGYTCECPDGYRRARDQKNCEDIDECSEGVDGGVWPCDGRDDGSGQTRAICTNSLGSYACSCRMDAHSWVGDGYATSLGGSGCESGCFPGSAKIWVKSGSGAVQRQIQDVRIGDYVRCLASPSEGYDHPVGLDWCYVAAWTHADPIRRLDHRRVTYRRFDGSTGNHTLTTIHYLYVLPDYVRVGTRLETLEGLKGTQVTSAEVPLGSKLAVGVRSASGVYDGFEVVEVVSVEPDEDAIGWYLFATRSPFVMVDDVVASNNVWLSVTSKLFPEDRGSWGPRYFFALSTYAWTAQSTAAMEAPVGTPGNKFLAVRKMMLPSPFLTLLHLTQQVTYYDYTYDVEAFWAWWLPKYEAWKANPGSPGTAVSRQQLVGAMLAALVPPRQEQEQDGAGGQDSVTRRLL